MSWRAALVAVCLLVGVLAAGTGARDAPARRLRGVTGGAGRRRRLLRWWPRRNQPRAAAGADPSLVLDLVAAALAAGAPPPTALKVVGQALGGTDGAALRGVADRLLLGAGEAAAWDGSPPWTAHLRRCLALSARTGAPAAGLLRDRAAELRRTRRRSASAAAQRLGVRVVLPLGLCALPGFAAWGVVPVVLGLAGQVLGG